MTRKQRRLTLIGASIGVLAIAAALVLSALRESIVFFNSPTDVVEKRLAPGTRMRVGGLVKPGTVERGANLQISFSVTDGKTDVPVRYQGIVPDLFREGQGVIAEGKLEPDGKLEDYFGWAVAMAFDPADNLYAYDANRGRISVYYKPLP